MNTVAQQKCIDSPLGKITLRSIDNKLIALEFQLSKSDYSDKVLDQAAKQLTEYFRGKRKNFKLNCDVRGTEFQKQAWSALTQIPYAKTWSYQKQAIKIGNQNKCRAVGRANGANPLPIIIPCHRVVAKNGDLTGYSNGLQIKSYLLNLEQKYV